MKSLHEAFKKMADSFFRMADAVEQAQDRLQRMLREEYENAGSPHGDTPEGLERWQRERLQAGKADQPGAGRVDVPSPAPAVQHDMPPAEHLQTVIQEIRGRLN